jgi:hypothetical protein
MSNYTGFLTGDYYFQLNTGMGFLEATVDKTIGYTVNDYDYSYPHGLKREIVNDLFGEGTTGFFAEFSVGADIFRIKKGSYESYEGTVFGGDTKCILWDEKNNFVVGNSDSNPGIAGNSNANSILGGVTHSINTSDCSSILGGSTNIITNSYYSSAMGHVNRICNAGYSNSFGYNNCTCSAVNSHILGYNNSIYTSHTVIFGYNNHSYGGNGNFINGNNNIVCSQAGHYNGTILGGGGNSVYGAINTVLGGITNKIGADADQVSETNQNSSIIGNGICHYVLGSNSTLMNGTCNRVIGHNNFMGGGFRNCIDVTTYNLFYDPSQFDSIQNEIPRGNFIGNGYFNKILDTAQSSIIVGGKQNVIQSGIYSSILGGFNNSIENAPNSFIIGSRSHITNLFDITGGISGAGIISDGYAPVWNFESNKLLINFKNGMILTPGIKISSSSSMPKDGLDTVAEDIRYIGYTGISYPMSIAESTRIVNIGIGNTIQDYTDISGLSTGENGVILEGVFNRNFNPSIALGNYNRGGHANLLLGIGNVHHWESYEHAKDGFAKWSGVYGENYVQSGFLTQDIKIVNKGPWANVTRFGWPVYQGANIMIGSLNNITGTKNIILGNQNNLSGISNGSLVIGEANSVLLPDTTFLLDPTTSSVTGVIWGTGLWPLTRQVISIGFTNTNLRGTDSIDFGHSNMSKTNYSQVIGRRNWTTGDFLVALGSELSSKGYRSANIGYGNLMMGESGYYNHIFGYNNIIDDYRTNPFKGTYNNQLIGNVNYVRGHNNLAVGQRNIIDTLSGFSGNYTNYSITVGSQNNAYGSYNGLFGMYNRSTGLSNYVFGLYNNVQALETTTLGITNNNYGERSVILGNTNAAYGINNTIIGNQGYAVNSNQISLGGGDGLASWPGSSQKNYLFWKGITSGTTRTELMLDGVNAASNDYISGKAFIHSGMVWNGKINIIAAETGLGNIFTQERYVTVANKNNGIHVISNQLISSSTSGTAAWGITLSGDNTNKAICINATGEAAKFIYWNIVGEFNQVFVPTNETIYRKEYSSNSINNNLLKSGYDLWSSIDPNMTIWQTASRTFFR